MWARARARSATTVDSTPACCVNLAPTCAGASLLDVVRAQRGQRAPQRVPGHVDRHRLLAARLLLVGGTAVQDVLQAAEQALVEVVGGVAGVEALVDLRRTAAQAVRAGRGRGGGAGQGAKELG